MSVVRHAEYKIVLSEIAKPTSTVNPSKDSLLVVLGVALGGASIAGLLLERDPVACTGFAALGVGAVIFNQMEPRLVGKQELRLTGIAVQLAGALSSPGATEGAHAVAELPDTLGAPKELPSATERVVLSSRALDDFAAMSNSNAKDRIAFALRSGNFAGADERSEGDVRGVDALAARFGQHVVLARRTEESLFVVAIVEVDPGEFAR